MHWHNSIARTAQEDFSGNSIYRTEWDHSGKTCAPRGLRSLLLDMTHRQRGKTLQDASVARKRIVETAASGNRQALNTAWVNLLLGVSMFGPGSFAFLGGGGHFLATGLVLQPFTEDLHLSLICKKPRGSKGWVAVLVLKLQRPESSLAG